MNIRDLALLLLFLIVSAGIISCKKKKNDNPFGSASIATIDKSHQGAITHYHIFYDAYNNVDSIAATGDGAGGLERAAKTFAMIAPIAPIEKKGSHYAGNMSSNNLDTK